MRGSGKKKETKIASHAETLFLISGQTVFGLPPQILVTKNKRITTYCI